MRPWLRFLKIPPLPASDLLRDLAYRRLWTSIVISSFGGQVTMLALPLTAAVLLHASPTQMGLLTAMEIAPFVLFSLPTGVFLDRIRKLPVYIVGELTIGVVVASVPLGGAGEVFASICVERDQGLPLSDEDLLRLEQLLVLLAPVLLVSEVLLAGYAVSAGWGGADGNRLVIDHGIVSGVDLATTYNHLTSWVVTGGHVARGQLVAYSGTTGFSTGCHLHFETRQDGTPVNPRNWL